MYFDLPAVGLHDAAAQGKAKAHAPAAIALFYRRRMEHVKDARLLLLADSRPVVGHFKPHPRSVCPCPHTDGRSLRGVLHRIVQQVDEHLHHELCVHAGHEQGFGNFGMQIVPRCPSRHDLHGFAHNVFKQLWLKPQGKVLLLQAGKRQQVFHHAHKVAGFFLYGRGQGRVAFCRACALRAGKNGGIAANTRKRGAQIVRNGAQNIGAQLFLLRPYRDAGVSPGKAFFFKCQRAFPGQRQHKVFAVGIGKGGLPPRQNRQLGHGKHV